MEIFSLVLPWFWIASAAWILIRVPRRSDQPGLVKAFAIVIVLIGVSDFFVTPSGPPPWWLVAWKTACLVAAVGILIQLRGASGGGAEK